jgi:hypothetical protein
MHIPWGKTLFASLLLAFWVYDACSPTLSRFHFRNNYLYQIPGEKTFNNPFVKRVLGGWQVTGFTEFQSGQPFTIRTGVDSVGQGTTAASRPNYNPGGVFIKDPVDGTLRTFTIPINGTGIVVTPLTTAGLPVGSSMPNGGNLGRNTFRGPGYRNWNFGLVKTIAITERSNYSFGATGSTHSTSGTSVIRWPR